MDVEIKGVYEAILEGNTAATQTKVQDAIDHGINPSIILDGMVAAMSEVGLLFEKGEYYVPEMLIAARAMKSGLSLLKPRLKEANIQAAGRVAIGTVKGDLHDIGKNLVGMMLEGAGYEIIDLGSDVSPEQFVDAVQNQHVDVIGLSALLTTTMNGMQAVIDSLQAAGLREHVKVVIGGAPVTDGFMAEIGADGYGPDASRAVTLVNSLLSH